MRFPSALCEKCLGEAFSALSHGDFGRAQKALGSAREAFAGMNQDIGDDVPLTPEELADFTGHIESIEGRLLLERGQVELSVQHLQSAVEQFRKTNNDALPVTINNLGIAYRQLGRTDEGLACYEECIDLFSAEGDELNVSMVQQNAGNLCQSVDRHEEAIRWYSKAGDGFARMNRKGKQAEVHCSRAMSCVALQRWDEAEKAYRRARDHYVSERNEALVAAIDHKLRSMAVNRD